MIPLQFQSNPLEGGEEKSLLSQILDNLLPTIDFEVLGLFLASLTVVIIFAIVVMYLVWLVIHRYLLRRRAGGYADDDKFVMALELDRWGIRSDSWLGRRRDGLIRWLLSADILGHRVFSGRLTGITSFSKNQCIYVLGRTRSGKTETIKVFVYQTMTDHDYDTPSVFLEYKDDYSEMMQRLGEECIIISTSGSTHIWNIFDEVDRAEDFRTVGEFFFPDPDNYFENAARQIFAAAMMHLWRENEGGTLSNTDLVEFVRGNPPDKIDEIFEKSQYDYTTARSHLGSKGDRTGSVISTLQSFVSDVFRGDFAKSPEDGKPSFSISEYINNPKGRHLILNLSSADSGGSDPVFRFLIDRGIQLALADGSDNPSHWFLDEFASIGDLEMIERLTNAGAGRSVQAIFGIQGYSQIVDEYGQSGGDSVSIGMPSQIAHALPADDDSAEKAKNRLWSDRDERIQQQIDTKEWDKREPVGLGGRAPDEGTLTSLNVGNAAIATPDNGWYLGRVKMLSEVRSLLDRVLPDSRSSAPVDDPPALPEDVEELETLPESEPDPEPLPDPSGGGVEYTSAPDDDGEHPYAKYVTPSDQSSIYRE